MRSVLLAAVVLSFPLLAQRVRQGNFTIYAEPVVKLQTDAPIPFQIRVTDPLNKPVVQATVSLQIETAEGRYVQVFPAPATDPGVYMAKPAFRAPGAWKIYIKVDRGDRESSRNLEYTVPRSTE